MTRLSSYLLPTEREAPADAEVVIDTSDMSPEEAAQEIILHLEREGFIGVSSESSGN